MTRAPARVGDPVTPVVISELADTDITHRVALSHVRTIPQTGPEYPNLRAPSWTAGSPAARACDSKPPPCAMRVGAVRAGRSWRHLRDEGDIDVRKLAGCQWCSLWMGVTPTSTRPHHGDRPLLFRRHTYIKRTGHCRAHRPSTAVTGPGWANQAFGATLDRPLMMRSIASPPVGSVRLASIFSVNFISSGCVRPRWVATFMTFGFPISFTKARPIV